jgi:hypothetical protein
MGIGNSELCALTGEAEGGVDIRKVDLKKLVLSNL